MNRVLSFVLIVILKHQIDQHLLQELALNMVICWLIAMRSIRGLKLLALLLLPMTVLHLMER